ncbi:unnamed protein product [Adineta steineri]|uniref:Uncharacterized protein n=1 Tax=Adineta steineri TaxID=433720 RepID=A0A815EV04_9BILA|nr:unnamed protein product [Adineta steineri]CAF3508048.1 unnamed protein product [Adineta steineri]
MKVVRQTEWTHGLIRDLCWSTKLNQVYITADSSVFMMDPQTMVHRKILQGNYYDNCTCSRDKLYLTVQPGREVLAHLFSNFLLGTCVFRCQEDGFIEDICYNAGKLGLVINSRNGTKPHVEILSTTTYARLFSITITDTLGYNLCRISSLGSSGWLVKDPGTYNIHHITENNTLRMTPMYDYGHPYNASRFGAGHLVVFTATTINLHKLKFVPIDDLTPSEVWK